MKAEIDGTKFAFKDARVPRVKKPLSRLQLLAGEQTTDINENHAQTPHEHHRVNTYYRSLDKVITEMSARFEGNDQDILCALGDTVLNGSPSTTSVEMVSALYGVDKDLLDAEKSMFVASRHFLFGGTIFQCLPTHEDISAHNDGARALKQHCNNQHRERIYQQGYHQQHG